jgi:cyclophilin family peptidyl-prolyl cis-trans isomerase
MRVSSIRSGLLRLAVLSLLLPVASRAGSDNRSDKLDIILRQQDSRMLYQSGIRALLSDTDRVVREHAVRSFGSIQDTAFIPELLERLMTDTVPVQLSAAFAIGQTATLLGDPGKRALEHDLIWSRIDRLPTPVASRLMEEIGKFGTREGLQDLVQHFTSGGVSPGSEPLFRAIARFAIRGITFPDASRYCAAAASSPSTATWPCLYALQRIGNQPEVRDRLADIARLSNHPDPLVRMNCATLLGKVRDAGICLEPLERMADNDPDWRVRVNAFKALGNYDLSGQDRCLRTFRLNFTNQINEIAVQSIASIAGSGLHKKDTSESVRSIFTDLEQMSLNSDRGVPWQLQAEAAAACAKLEGSQAISVIKPSDDNSSILNEALLNAAGSTGSPKALSVLLRFAGSRDAVVARASLEGLLDLSQRRAHDTAVINATWRAAVSALGNSDMAVKTTGASILGDSLFLRKESIPLLRDALQSLQLPYDLEALQQIASALGTLHATSAVDVLRDNLNLRDRAARTAIVAALRQITGHEPEAPENLEPQYVDYDFAFLHALPDTVRMELSTVRGTATLELYKDVAPFTVMSFIKLAEQKGFYKGLMFHRLVPNFVVQGGDPRGDGWGGPGYALRSEFSALRYETGTIGMASSGKDSEGSQFFITHSPQPHLDGHYTIIGRVIRGMECVDRIERGDRIVDLSRVP